MTVSTGCVDVDERGERALELADVAAQRREQRVVDALVGGVVATRHGAGEVRSSASHCAADGCGSQMCTSRWLPRAPSSSASVAAMRVCPNSESRGGMALGPGAGTEVADDARMPLRRRRGVGGGEQVPPQLGLPAQVVGDLATVAVLVAPVGPRREQRRPLDGVGGEQPGETTGHRVAAAPAQLAFLALAARDRGGRRGWRTTAPRRARRARRAPTRRGRRATTGRRRRCR